MTKKQRALALFLLLVLFLLYQATGAAPASTETSRCRPDVNLDGEVNLFDLVVISRFYGSYVSPGSQEDTNLDGKVDIFDLVCVSTNIRPCSCLSNRYDCSDFPSEASAQACYEYCLRIVGYDIHRLDNDADGSACECDLVSTPIQPIIPIVPPTLTSTPTRQPPPTPTPTRTATWVPPPPTPTRTRTPAPPSATPTLRPTVTPSPTASQTWLTQAWVRKVIDGDTIEVVIAGNTYTVRYIGIDTPETVHPDKPVEWMGKEASDANEALVEGKMVYLEKDVSETDKYGRLLRYVWIGDLMVNAELVRLGFAQVSTYPPDVRYQDLFLRLQQEARDAGRGLWGPTPTAVMATPTATVVPTRPVGQANVIIRRVLFDGVVPRVESDEYAEILNQGSDPVNLRGWLLNAGDRGQDFIFPDFVQQPGQACRVYTNEFHPETCGFSFNSPRAIWNNDGDCGYLYDATGQLASRYCY